MHVPYDFGLHKSEVVSTVPVPQHPFVASVNPVQIMKINVCHGSSKANVIKLCIIFVTYQI